MTAPALHPGGTAPFNMTILGEALVRRMTEVFVDFRLPNDNPDISDVPEEAKPVTIYLGSVKARARSADGTQAKPEFPFVMVKPRVCTDDAGESGAQETIIKVDFVIGVRRIGSETGLNEGYLDVTAIAERIRTNLLRSPVIEKRARMELPLESEIGDDDAYPQWFGIVSAKFNIPQPVEEIANE